MAYRGYISERAFYNAKCHALSEIICGSREVMEQEIVKAVAQRKNPLFENVPSSSSDGKISVTQLTDMEAKNLYRKLSGVASQLRKNQQAANEIIGVSDAMTVDQRKAIIRIASFGFKWQIPATFSFILEAIPRLRKKLSSWEIENSKIKKLYGLMTKKDADLIIKKLDQIKKRNKQNSEL